RARLARFAGCDKSRPDQRGRATYLVKLSVQLYHEEISASPHPLTATNDGRIGHGLMGDDRAPNCNDRTRQFKPDRISAHGYRESRGIAAISARRDDRARETSGGPAME